MAPSDQLYIYPHLTQEHLIATQMWGGAGIGGTATTTTGAVTQWHRDEVQNQRAGEAPIAYFRINEKRLGVDRDIKEPLDELRIKVARWLQRREACLT